MADEERGIWKAHARRRVARSFPAGILGSSSARLLSSPDLRFGQARRSSELTMILLLCQVVSADLEHLEASMSVARSR